LVWTAQGGVTTHDYAAMQVLAEGKGTRIVWTIDFLPIAAMNAGIAAIGAHRG